jgi:hypothetical protein
LPQEKHVETAKLLLGEGKELNAFVSRLLDDIANLKAMLHAISIGETLLAWLLKLHIPVTCQCDGRAELHSRAHAGGGGMYSHRVCN